MTEIEAVNRLNPSHAASGDERSRALRIAAFVCIALLAFLMFVQAAHVHPAGSNPDQCPICVAMHSAAPVAAVLAVAVMACVTRIKTPARERSVFHNWHFILYNRPPPSMAR